MKPDRLKHHFLSRLSLRESWIIFFILGIIMLNYPFLHIFNKPVEIFGLPVLLIYIIGGWAASILVIYLFTKSIKSGDDNDNDRLTDR
jgi:hypothetical protein